VVVTGLSGRVALVTGSTRGIGRAVAAALVAEGTVVVVHGRDEETAGKTASDLGARLGVGADLADRAALDEVVRRVTDGCGPVNILVNNAGISSRAAITRVTDEDWDAALAVNLTGPLCLTRAVVPGMKRLGRGVILNVVSGAGTYGIPGFSAYGASKGGLLALTMTWAKELQGFGIRVNAMAPAALTDMLRQLPPDELERLVASGLPSVEAVAETAVFLLSDQSRHSTGQLIQVGG